LNLKEYISIKSRIESRITELTQGKGGSGEPLLWTEMQLDYTSLRVLFQCKIILTKNHP